MWMDGFVPIPCLLPLLLASAHLHLLSFCSPSHV